MSGAILVLNAGSSSVKFALYADPRASGRAAFRGLIERIGTEPRFTVKDDSGDVVERSTWAAAPAGEGHRYAFDRLREWIDTRPESASLAAVGHRVVHGGIRYRAPVRITADVIEYLDTLTPLAPLHQPHNLAPIRAIREAAPDVAQVACFDTAFHQGHAEVFDRMGLPEALHREGVRRYGFHGLSYEFVAQALRERSPETARGRVIAAHLGNGASLCAMRDGASVDGTMGFTALDGLPMGTRCGRLDPGVVLYLQRERGMSVDEVEDLLYERSGLLGISGLSNDMRVLLASDAAGARDAIDFYVHRIAQEVGSLTASLGGVDALVFTAGIGENAPEIRARVALRLAWLGVALGEAANEAGEGCISAAGSSPSVWVIATDEERMIAMHAAALLDARDAR